MSELSERIKMAERQAYFRAHEKEYPFPLDGSNWARLIREKQFLERHPHCRCDSCLNLLTRLHDKDTMLIRQRKMIMKAMHHWFIHDANLANLFWTEQLSAEELAKFKIALQKHVTDKVGPQLSLKSSEDDWLSHKAYSKADHPEYLEETWLHGSLKHAKALEAQRDTEKWLSTETEGNSPKSISNQLETVAERAEEAAALDWEI